MNRLTDTFARAKAANRKLLCPFLTAGYPSIEATPRLLLAAQEGGAGIVELGIPFSDPVADGPTVQASFTHALAGGVTVAKSLAAVKDARKLGLTIPIIAMVSFSIIYKRGTEKFAEECRANELDGVILPDIPLEEAPAVVKAFAAEGLTSTLLIAPTTPPERREKIARLCDGFIYYLSVSGITGERTSLPPDIEPNIRQIRTLTQVPICVGFGISTSAHVKEVTALAEGAIVGSAVIRCLRDASTKAGSTIETQASALKDFIAELATGLGAQ